MSRSVAATAAGRQRSLPRTPAPHHPRRVSGPTRRPARPPRAQAQARALAAPGVAAYPRPQRLPARPPLRVVAGGAAIASRVAGVALDVSGSRAMDRLVRSRGWIVIVAFGLIGIVAMQVSMLKLNAGIGRAVETENTLERTNSSLRGEVSRLQSGDRIRSLAGARGFVMPAPADVTYMRAGSLRADGASAARHMRAPDPAIAGPAGAAAATTLANALGVVAPAGQTQASATTAPATSATGAAAAPATGAATAPATGAAAAPTTAAATAPPSPAGAQAAAPTTAGVAPPTAAATAP
jgi:hypothetical protein